MINCNFRSNSQPVCLLGMYGGMPSSGTCKRCIEQGQNTLEYSKKQISRVSEINQIKTHKLPSLPQQAASLGKSLINWTSSNFSVTPPEILNKRLEICKACPEWDPNALMGTGRCKKCGCSTQAKLRMATEKCPIDKWGPVTDQPTEASTKTDEKNKTL